MTVFLFICFILIFMMTNMQRSYYTRQKPIYAATVLSHEMFLFADDSGEKTEDPTPRKLRESRKKGQVVKSNDLNAAIILVVSVILMSLLAEHSFKNMCEFVYISFTDIIDVPLIKENIRHIFSAFAFSYLRIVSVTFGIIMVMGVIANLAQSGFVFSVDPLKPNLNKINPIEGFKNLFSKRTVFNLFKTLLKFLFIGIVAYTYVRDNIDKIFAVSGVGLHGLYPYVKDLIYHLTIRVVAVMLVLGIIDFIFQKYDYKKRLRMSKQDIKEEHKQTEGDPQIRSFRRQRQRQISMNRMMAEVTDATVVVTNPTHLAIALKYELETDEAPLLVGKGADYVAAKIREVAKEEDIPIIENKPLAQVLYKKVEVGQEVPPALYQAVAEILAVVFKMKKGKRSSI